MQLTYNLSGQTIQLPDEIRDLAQAHSSDMMDAGELQYLAAALATVPWETGPLIVVEIGAYRGKTTVFIAKALGLLGFRVPIVSIDPFERAGADPANPQGSYSLYLQTLSAAGVETTCLPVVAFSRDAAPVIPMRVGLLVIDGDHHDPSPRMDIGLYAPKVWPGGIIFVDDYVPTYPDVMLAVDESDELRAHFMLVHKTWFVVARRRIGRWWRITHGARVLSARQCSPRSQPEGGMCRWRFKSRFRPGLSQLAHTGFGQTL